VGGPSSLVAVPFYQCVGFFLRWQSETAINSGSLPLVPRKGKGKCQRDKETMRCCSRIDEQFLWLLSEMVAPEAFKLVAIFQKLINPIKGHVLLNARFPSDLDSNTWSWMMEKENNTLGPVKYSAGRNTFDLKWLISCGRWRWKPFLLQINWTLRIGDGSL